MKKFKKYKFLITLFAFGLLMLFIQLKGKSDLALIEKTGHYFQTVISDKISGGSRGSSYSFAYSYKIGNRQERTRSYVNYKFYHKLKIGDTIIIMSTIQGRIISKVCEDIEYNFCFGKQPENGWKEIPICK